MSRWDIELDHVRERQDKGCDQQAEVFVRVCRLAKEVGKHVAASFPNVVLALLWRS